MPKRKSPFRIYNPRNIRRRVGNYVTPPSSSRRRVSTSSSSSNNLRYLANRLVNTPVSTYRNIYNTAKTFYNKFSAYRRSKALTLKKKEGFSGMSTAKYAGKFKRPSSTMTAMEKLEADAQSKGIMSVREVHGKINSANCVYIGHGNFDLELVAFVISLSIVRKLLRKIGTNPTSANSTLNTGDPFENSSGWQFQFRSINTNGAYVSSTPYDFPTTVTMNGIASSSGLYTFILQSIRQDSPQTHGCLQDVVLRVKDNSVGDSWKTMATLNMKNEIMNLWSYSDLKIQNRTKSDEGSANADSVDNQPLTGYHYLIKGGAPQAKQIDNFKLSRNGYRSVILLRAEDLSDATDYQEPPNPVEFSNCYRASKVLLQPGNLKKSNILTKWSGYFNDLIGHKLTIRQAITGGTTQNVEYAPGKCELFAFEEILNTGSTNLITCAYESEKKVGCTLTTGPYPVCTPGFDVQTFTNVGQ